MILTKVKNEVGATAIEYGLLSALIAITTIVALQSTGTNLGTTYCTIANKLSQAVGAGATASGCSATPSNPSSSPSSVSANNSSTGIPSRSSETSSCGPGGQCNTSNSYSFGNEQNVKDFFRVVTGFGITNMSGFYDSNGTPITTPSQLAGLFGPQAEKDFNNEMSDQEKILQNNVTVTEADYATAISAFQADIDNYYSRNPSANPIFFSDPSSVSFSGSYPVSNQTYQTTYSATGINGNHYLTGLTGLPSGLSNINFDYNTPTVHGN